MELAIAKNQQDLERLEGIITRNLQSFYEVGRALMEIRDKHLYEKVRGIATFETYCKERWDFKRTYAFYLIESSRAVDNVHSCEQKPTTEAQCRPLIQLRDEPDQQREAWKQAVESAPDGKVTASIVMKVVRGMRASTETPAEKSSPIEVTEAMGIATFIISHLERIRENDPRRNDAIRKVINWCNKNMGNEN